MCATGPSRSSRRDFLKAAGTTAAVGAAYPLLQGGSRASAAEPVTITWTTWGDKNEYAIFQRTADAFHKLYPNITVNMIEVDNRTYQTKLLSEYAAGAPPDAIRIGETMIGILSQSHQLKDLSGYLKAGKPMDPNDIFPSVLNAATFKGHTYALPDAANPLVLYYNETMFKQAGLKTPWEYIAQGKWNWATFAQAAKALSSPRGAGHPAKYGFMFDGTWWAMWYPFIWQNGGDIFSPDGKKCTLNSKASVEAMTWLTDMVFTQKSALHEGLLPKGQGIDSMFMQGNGAMELTGRWVVPTFTQSITSFKWDICPLPTGRSGRAWSSTTGDWQGVSTASKHQAEAWAWISYFSGPAGQRLRLSGPGNAVPSLRSLESLVLTPGKPPAHASYFVDVLKVARPFPTPEEIYPELDTVISKEMDLVWLGQEDAKTAADKVVAQVNAILAKPPA